MAASFFGHSDIARMLIKANAQVNTQGEVGMLLWYYPRKTCKTHQYVNVYLAFVGSVHRETGLLRYLLECKIHGILCKLTL